MRRTSENAEIQLARLYVCESHVRRARWRTWLRSEDPAPIVRLIGICTCTVVVMDITYGFDEDFRLFCNDSIAVTAQTSHSGGRAISQRECAGFNGPPSLVSAEEPVSI